MTVWEFDTLDFFELTSYDYFPSPLFTFVIRSPNIFKPRRELLSPQLRGASFELDFPVRLFLNCSPVPFSLLPIASAKSLLYLCFKVHL